MSRLAGRPEHVVELAPLRGRNRCGRWPLSCVNVAASDDRFRTETNGSTRTLSTTSQTLAPLAGSESVLHGDLPLSMRPIEGEWTTSAPECRPAVRPGGLEQECPKPWRWGTDLSGSAAGEPTGAPLACRAPCSPGRC